MKNAIIITGIRDIDKKLRTLEPRLQKKVLRQAMRSGLKVQAAEVKAQAAVDTGLMRSSVKVRAVKRKKRGSISLEVAISAKTDGLVKQSANGGAFYPAIEQYGSEKQGRAADPFATRAFESKGEASRQVTIAQIRAGIEREASK